MSQAQWHISTVAAPFDSFADSTKKIESMHDQGSQHREGVRFNFVNVNGNEIILHEVLTLGWKNAGFVLLRHVM
jgi:hypothetical protein